MSVFEAAMLICFGASWPFSLYKTWKSKCVYGKSIRFSVLVLTGYICGIIHKLLYSFDIVIWLYIIDSLFLVTDIALWFRYKNNKVSVTEVVS